MGLVITKSTFSLLQICFFERYAIKLFMYRDTQVVRSFRNKKYTFFPEACVPLSIAMVAYRVAGIELTPFLQQLALAYCILLRYNNKDANCECSGVIDF